jgi:hypothetical protein
MKIDRNLVAWTILFATSSGFLMGMKAKPVVKKSLSEVSATISPLHQEVNTTPLAKLAAQSESAQRLNLTPENLSIHNGQSNKSFRDINTISETSKTSRDIDTRSETSFSNFDIGVPENTVQSRISLSGTTAQERLESAESKITDPMTKNNILLIEHLKDYRTSQLFEFLTVAPKIQTNNASITRSAVVSAISLKVQDATGIRTLLEATKNPKPLTYLNNQISAINRNFSKAVDLVFGKKKSVKRNDERSSQQTRLEQIQNGLTKAFSSLKTQFESGATSLKQQFTPLLTSRELYELAEKRQLQEVKNLALKTGSKMSKMSKLHDTENKLITDRQYVKFLNDISYADLRLNLMLKSSEINNPSVVLNTLEDVTNAIKNNKVSNGFSSRPEVAVAIADKMILDAGLAPFLVSASNKMEKARVAISETLSALKDTLVTKLTQASKAFTSGGEQTNTMASSKAVISGEKGASQMISSAMTWMSQSLQSLQIQAKKLISRDTSKTRNPNNANGDIEMQNLAENPSESTAQYTKSDGSTSTYGTI